MAGICCGVVGEAEASTTIDASPRNSRRRRLELPPLKYMADVAVKSSTVENGRKRQKIDLYRSSSSVPQKAVESSSEAKSESESEGSKLNATVRFGDDDFKTVNTRGDHQESKSVRVGSEAVQVQALQESPRFGMTSVCGRRRDMEDAVSIHPSFYQNDGPDSNGAHFYGVFDGHGCSHVIPPILI